MEDFFLPEAITTKVSSGDTNAHFKVGCSAMQGFRRSMEDNHVIFLSMIGDSKAAFFGVFDGHNGSEVSEYTKDHINRHIMNQDTYPTDIPAALEKAFNDLSRTMYDLKLVGGSTAIICIIRDNRLYCANVGDSRMIAYSKGKINELSSDHVLSNPKELARIMELIGLEEIPDDEFLMTRTLGDFEAKKGQMKDILISKPEVIIQDISDKWEFAVIASDGIWEVLSNETVIEFIRTRIINGEELQIIAEQLLDYCLSRKDDKSGYDNMTVIIVLFLHDTADEKILKMIIGSTQF